MMVAKVPKSALKEGQLLTMHNPSRLAVQVYLQLLMQSNQPLKQYKVLHLSATSVEKLGTRPQIARKGELMLKARLKLDD